MSGSAEYFKIHAERPEATLLRIGIVGLAQVGKTTLFQILTRAHGSGPGAGRPETHVGVVRVPDARLDRLVEMFQRQKTIHATIEYVDTPAASSSWRGRVSNPKTCVS